MRRMRQALKRTYYLRKATPTKDSEGSTYPVYGEAQAIKAIIRHASGRMDVAQYGERLALILKMQYEDFDTVPIECGDGLCVYVGASDEPDYTVKAVKGLTEDTFKTYELEAV